MSNVIQFRQAEFVNVHGKPMGLSMRQLVLGLITDAWCHHREWKPSDDVARHIYTIRVPEFKGEPPELQAYIGTGATEEAAWRDAYTHIRVEGPAP